ncbi:protease [Ktedonosporobacter rubrisoli]|uniref:Protease n=1 Tax=Ktedonosporobacter rubrisoli TaxID=2509675 RepID=A0A4P6JU86_KTERU|nr:S53 family peptidase [Ktedonosporobacter rubrisoli]QBD79198.1 protease [Ktedonosporobacter rubrisoli]
MLFSLARRLRRQGSLSLIMVLIWSFLPAIGVPVVASSLAHAGALSVPSGMKATLLAQNTTPPTDAQCRAKYHYPCYSPQEIRKAYGVDALISSGFTGKGQTIVIIDSFGSPTLAQDLKIFDKGFGLPDPPSLRVLAPLGSVKFDPNNAEQTSWADETTLDVEWAHALAPDASIVLLTSPVAETQGVQGMPQFLELEKYALHNHLGKIISQSWGTTENTLFTKDGKKLLNEFNAFYHEGADEGVTFLASTGDTGSANPDANGKNYPFPTVGFPASSPWVTAVGGTSLYADTKGHYQSETVWNDGGSNGATGGGISQYFKEPDYQSDNLSSANKALLKGFRGIPDISFNADPNTPVLVYESFRGGDKAGYYGFGGTSAGSPQWAALVADANQLAGHPLGFLNSALYKLGASRVANLVFHDITKGNNSQAGIAGYNATPGWDACTGWGTPRVQPLLQDVIRLTDD